MSFPIVILPYYVKKEDAKKYYDFQHKQVGFVLLAYPIVASILQRSVLPKMLSLYEDAHIALPLSSQLVINALPLVTVCALFAGLYFLFSKPNYSDLEVKLAKYKPREMINVFELRSYKPQMIAFLFIGALIAMTVLALVMPIYRLTELSSLQP